jgi:hypothetical protein
MTRIKRNIEDCTRNPVAVQRPDGRWYLLTSLGSKLSEYGCSFPSVAPVPFTGDDLRDQRKLQRRFQSLGGEWC